MRNVIDASTTPVRVARVCDGAAVGKVCLAAFLLVACTVDKSGIPTVVAPPSDAASADGTMVATDAPGSGSTGGIGGVGAGGSPGSGGATSHPTLADAAVSGDGAMGGLPGGGGSTGGTRGTGGVIGAGGTTFIGTVAAGGSVGAGGTAGTLVTTVKGGAIGTGGSSNSGGVIASGGAIATGGGLGTGGSPGMGGIVTTAGTSGTLAATGGTTATGGVAATGGATGPGGIAGTGGVTGTGGTTACVLGPFGPPELITGLGRATGDLFGPSLSSDGLTLYFAVTPNLGDDEIYVATRTDRGVAFKAATALSAVNGSSDDGSPAISNDGLTLYFYSSRFGGLGGRDLWYATRTSAQGTFGNAHNLGGVNGLLDDSLAWLSADELTIIFSSTRSGASDLYTAKRATPTADFGYPTQVGGVNGVMSSEDRAALSNDGTTLYFTSNRAGTVGDKDIWTATKNAQGEFGTITNLDVVNTAQRDIDVALSADERELFFSSNRSGARFQLYRSIRNCQ